MTIIRSGEYVDHLTIDGSKALRAVLYDLGDTFIGQQETYSWVSGASGNKLATAAGTADCIVFLNPSNYDMVVTQIQLCATVATTAVYADVGVYRRQHSILRYSGGTIGGAGAFAYDTENAVSYGVDQRFYTTLPTSQSTAAGLVATGMVFAPVTGTPAALIKPLIFDFSGTESEPLVVEPGQALAIAFLTTTTNAPTLTSTVQYLFRSNN